MVAFVLAGCRSETPEATSTCDASWAADAAPFLASWCVSCHASTATGEARHGAPVGADFDLPSGVAQQADAIRQVVAAATMPPGGGPDDEARTDLVAWIDCGLPGLPSDPPAADAGCDTAVRHVGDVVSSSDPCADVPWLAVDGSLDVDVDVDLGCLCEITGDLTVQPAVANWSSPHLRSIGGNLVLVDVAVGTPDLPRLASVAGDLRVLGAVAVTDLDRWSGLETVGGNVEVADCPSFDGHATLPWLDAAASVRFADLPGLTVLGGLPAFRSGDLSVQHAPALTSIEGLMTWSEGGLALERLDVLDRLAPTAVPAVLTSLRLVDLAILADVNALGVVGEVTGDLVVESCPLLDLEPLFGVGTVGGDLTLRSLPSTDRAAVEAWLETVAVGGIVVVEDVGT